MAADLETIADEVYAAAAAARQVPPFTSRPPGLTFDEAYRATALLNARRQAKGEKQLGRKIGFTNRNIWGEYKVYAPIWGYIYDSTVRDLSDTSSLPVSQFCEPRIEPEIVFGLGRAPAADMDEAALLACVEWVGHGFEIVHSVFPNWLFGAADTIAANALHGALLIGARLPIGLRAVEWQGRLAAFEIDLLCDGRLMDRGHAANVLDGPLSALRHLVGVLACDADNPPLSAGEIVTTGTLTRALPVHPGETWSTVLRGIGLAGIRLRFE